MKTVKIILFACAFFTLNASTYAQYYENKEEEEESRLIDKLFFGGNVGLQFGNFTAIEVAPIVGYKITERIHAGVGGSYSYYADNRYNPKLDYSTYGGNVFTRIYFIETIFAHAEAEMLSTEIYSLASSSYSRGWVESYFVGAGFYQKITKRAGAYFMVLWNLNHTEYSPYSNPVFRVGFVL